MFKVKKSKKKTKKTERDPNVFHDNFEHNPKSPSGRCSVRRVIFQRDPDKGVFLWVLRNF